MKVADLLLPLSIHPKSCLNAFYVNGMVRCPTQISFDLKEHIQ